VRIIARMEAEQDNFRAALTWVIDQADAAMALRLTANLWKFWLVRSRLGEGRDWLERSLSVPGDVPPSVKMDAHYGAGTFARLQSHYSQAVGHGEAGLALARGLDDPFHAAQALYLLGLVAHYQGDIGQTRAQYEEALELTREAGAAHLEAMILTNLGDSAAAGGDLLVAQERYEQALGIWRGRGDKWGMGIALLNLGNTALRTGDLPRARVQFREGLTMSLELGDRARVADYLDAAGRFAATTGRWESAARLLGTATTVYKSIGIEQFPDHRGEHERAVVAARAGLGDEGFRVAQHAGQTLPPEHAVDEALSVVLTPV
jgi:tetratricopeptide (TPR) repeat protein